MRNKPAPRKRKPMAPLKLTEEEIKGSLAAIGAKHRALGDEIFKRESFRAKIEGDTIVLTSHSARSVLHNGKKLKNVKVVFDKTDNNKTKHEYPEYYEKVTEIHKAIMTDIAEIWQPW